jgi:hypothetical protein
LSPTVNHEIGVSAHRGAYNLFSADGAAIDERRDLTIAVFDFETRLLGTTLGGEAAVARINVPPGLRGIYAEKQHGWYVEGVREFGRGKLRALPESSVALKVRWDFVDFDAAIAGETAARVTGGLTFRPTRDSALKFDYARGRSRDRFNNLSEQALLLASIATYF